jgi:hypothetical protein
MITIEKSEVADWLLLSCKSEHRKVKEKIDLFVQKYNQAFSDFELEVKNTEQENFGKWDDYIEWKAYQQSYSNLKHKIAEIEKGHFTVS